MTFKTGVYTFRYRKRKYAMTDNKSTLGRPRLYPSNSAKVSAFRQRLDKAGYLRKEALVSQETATRVESLASQNGVRPVDVYSALVEMGLESYDRDQAPASPLAFAALSAGQLAAPAATGLTSPSLPGDNPITRFFQRRKELLDDNK